MKNSKSLEVVVGLFVIAGLLALTFLAYRVSQINRIGKDGMYRISANFSTVSGLNAGSSVMMAGVKIGYIEKITLNKNFDANVVMLIDNKYNKIPQDTSASVLTAGLLGEKYMGLSAGGLSETLKDGDVIDLTKSSMVIENLIDKFILNSSMNSSKENKTKSN